MKDRYAIAFVLLSAAQACSAPSAKPVAPAQSTAPTPATPVASNKQAVVFLYTTDEHGWLLPREGRGGAVGMLSKWLTDEKHCVPGEGQTCTHASTVALSGGDNWTGPAISSYFQGRPMIEVMNHMGYAASALGNHEFDFGYDILVANLALQRFPSLAVNVQADRLDRRLPIKPFTMVERAGLRLAILGAITPATPTISAPSNVEGLTFTEIEPGLGAAVQQAWGQGADVVVALIHACDEHVKPMIGRNPDWRLAFVGVGHCHRVVSTSVAGTPIVGSGSGLEAYVRVRVVVDKARPARERVVEVRAELIDVGPPSDAPAPGTIPLQQSVAHWQDKVDQVLGETVGFSSAGMMTESPEMVRWILGSWRSQLHADVALVNRSAFRQNLAPGPIKIRHIYDILPFNNALVRLRLTGKRLEQNLDCCEPLVDGLRRTGSGWALANGKPIEPDRTYDVIVPDFIYLGGDGFSLRDGENGTIGADWRSPVIEWTRAQRSSTTRPLEGSIK